MVGHKLALSAGAVRSGPIDDIFSALACRPETISFAVGSPDTALLPVELLPRLVEAAVARSGPVVLQYGMTRGFEPLLERLLPVLRRRQVDCPPDQLHIATGGSGALHTVCMVVLDPGDVVLVESPSYGPAVKAFRSHGAVVLDVPCDAHGMLPDALERAIIQHRPALVYLLPTFQNPTGRTMPAARRAEVGAVLCRHGVLAVEDDVYAELRYRGEPQPALWSFAPEHTVYLTSLSKILAPAVRIGAAALPPDLMGPVLAHKQIVDMQTSTLCQAIAAEFLDGPAAEHRDRIVAAYATRLGLLAEALRMHLPADFSWSEPDGGMFLWVEGPPGRFDADALLPHALESGVVYMPGSGFYAQHPENHRNTIRFSFANVAEAQIETGVKLLAGLIRDTMQE